MASEKRVRLDIAWQRGGETMTTFLEFVDLPDNVSQREFFDLCIEVTEQFKRLGHVRIQQEGDGDGG